MSGPEVSVTVRRMGWGWWEARWSWGYHEGTTPWGNGGEVDRWTRRGAVRAARRIGERDLRHHQRARAIGPYRYEAAKRDGA